MPIEDGDMLMPRQIIADQVTGEARDPESGHSRRRRRPAVELNAHGYARFTPTGYDLGEDWQPPLESVTKTVDGNHGDLYRDGLPEWPALIQAADKNEVSRWLMVIAPPRRG